MKQKASEVEAVDQLSFEGRREVKHPTARQSEKSMGSEALLLNSDWKTNAKLGLFATIMQTGGSILPFLQYLLFVIALG